MKKRDGSARRSYTMGERARAADETRLRILEAVIAHYLAPLQPEESLTVTSVARAADVTPQTILRIFGDREGLIQGAYDHARHQLRRHDIPQQRTPAEMVSRLADFYEDYGEAIIRFFHEASTSVVVARVVVEEREYQRRWCSGTLSRYLVGLDEALRTRRIAQAAGVCSVWTWHALRHEGGLSRTETASALLELIEPLLIGSTEPSPAARTLPSVVGAGR